MLWLKIDPDILLNIVVGDESKSAVSPIQAKIARYLLLGGGLGFLAIVIISISMSTIPGWDLVYCDFGLLVGLVFE